MKSSPCRLLAGTFMLAAASAQALKAPEVDLRDPTIWQEKAVSPLTAHPQPCEVFSGDEKSDIQRERERREQRRWQNGYENLRRE